MKYNLTLLKNIGRLINTACVYFILFGVFLTIYDGEIVYPFYLLGILVILISYLLIERYCYHPIPYVLLHAVFLAPILMIHFPVITYRYLYLVVFIAENIHGIYIWKQNVEKPYKEAPWALYIVIGTIYIIVTAYHMTDLSNMVYAASIILLIVHFFRLSIEGLGNTLVKTQNATSVPTNRIIATSFAMIIFISLGFLVTAIFVRIFHLEQSIYALGKFLMKILKVFIHLIMYVVAAIRLLFSRENQLEEEEEPMGDGLLESLEELQEPGLLAQILQTICVIAFLLVVIYLLYRILSYLIRIFFKRYAKDSDIIVTLHSYKDQTKSKTEKLSVMEKIKEILRTDNAMKLRHAYRLKVKSYPPELYPKSNTPKEIADNILEVYDEDIKELTNLYEKARYSNEEITIDEIKQGGVI